MAEKKEQPQAQPKDRTAQSYLTRKKNRTNRLDEAFNHQGYQNLDEKKKGT